MTQFYQSCLSKKTFSVVSWMVVLMVVILVSGFFSFVAPARASVNTFVNDASVGNFGPLRLKQGSSFWSALQVNFGSNENTKTLTSIIVSFTGTSGSPTWTEGQAVSSELLNLATTNGGVSLWKEATGIGFSSTMDTQVTLATNPVYGALNSFTITPATPPTLASDDVYYVVLKSDATGVTNNNAFTVTVPADGIVTSVSSPTITAVSTQPITIDTVAPTISSSNPANSATNVPISTVPRVQFNEAIDPTTVFGNVTFASGGAPANAETRPLFDSVEVVPSSPPTFTVGSRFAKFSTVSEAFFSIMGTNSIVPQGSYQTPVVGDVIYFQHDTFPSEVGLVSNATLTSGTFAVNGFPLMGGQQITKVATPTATGLVTVTTTPTLGDLIIVSTTANPTDQRYNWHIVTTAAAVNNSALRIDGASAAPTYTAGSRFSTITPTATTTDNGATTDGVLAISLGDLVFTRVGSGSYGWHIATTAGNLSSDATEGTAGLDGNTAANSLVASGAQMSKLTSVAQGAVTDTATTFAEGDLVFARTTANAQPNDVYAIHLVTADATGISSTALRFDRAPGSLTASASYALTVGVGITDRAGNALASQSVVSFITGSTGTTNTTPPAVTSTIPQQGNQSFSPNGVIRLTFSVDMASSGSGSVTNSSNVNLYTDNFGAPGTTVTTTNTYDSTTRTLTITPSSSLTASSGFIVRVLSTAKSATEVAFTQEFRLNFRTASVSDSTTPTVLGVSPAASSTGVSRSAIISIGFSEDINPATVSSTTLTLVKTSNLAAVSGSVSYNSSNRSATFTPSTQLEGNTGYTVRVVSGVSGVKDPANNALATDYTSTFTTTNTDDSTAPSVSFGNADNFGVTVTFSETMKSGGGPNAADNIVNYTLESPVNSSIALGGKTVTYDAGTKTARITGLSLQNGNQYKITVATQVQDLASNNIDTTGTPARNTSYGTVANATQTGGQLGPGSGTIDPGQQGMNPTRVFPMNRAAGATSNYKAEFLASTSVPLGGKIVLTFPAGFNVSAAAAVATAQSFCNADMNGPATGAVTIASVANDADAGTTTITTGGAASGSNAFLCLELSGIVNSSVPNTAGYTVDIKTRDTAANNLAILETKTTAPFFLGQTGSRTLTVNVFNDNGAGGGTASNNIKDGTEAGIASANVFLFNPGLGGQRGTTNASGIATFTSLTDGDYDVGLEPSSVAAAGYAFNSAPQRITISANTTKNFGLGAAPYTISGTVTGPASTVVDIFASSPNGFSKTVLTLTGGADAYSLPAQANTTYNVGVGPAMPDAAMVPGAPPPSPQTFNFMPPANLTVAVTTANRTGQNFTLTATNKTITGTVIDSTSTGVSNAGVFCRPFESSTGESSAGFGTGGMTNTSGVFTINVTPGVYLCGAFKPGMPPVSDKQITVPTSGSNSPTSLSFLLDAATNLTITGTIKDDSGNAIPYAGVSGRKVTSTSNTTPTGGDSSNFVGGPSDANGAYTLYVTAGTWVVEAFAPGFGRLGTKTITVAAANVTGQDFSAQTMSLGSISGTVTRGGTAVQGVMVRAQNAAGTNGNSTSTATDGTYSLKLPAGTYTVFAYMPGFGEATPLTGVAVTASTDTPNQNFSPAAPIAITINVTDGANAITNAGIDVRDSNGRGNFTTTSTISGVNAVYVVNVPPGTYSVRVGHPAFGPISSCPTSATLTGVNSTRTITCTVSSQTYAVTGTVTGDGANLSGAWASLSGTPTGATNRIFTGTQSGTNGTFSISVPPGSYKLRVDKPGYKSPAETTMTVTNAPVAAGTVALTTAALTITGTITLSSAGVSGVFVDASDGTGGYAVAQSDSTGAYSLAVSNGTWSLRAHGQGYDGGPLSVTVSGTSRTGQNIALTAISGFTLTAEKPETVTPTAGGFITNPDIGSGFRLNIPANALGTSSNAATLTTKVNTALPNPPTGAILSENAVTISAVDSSGSPIKTLNDDMTISIPYTEADLPAGVSESSLVIGVYNDATQSYDSLSTTVDATNNTLTATVSHLSDFAPLVPTDPTAPDTPTGLTALSIGVGSIRLDWTAVSAAASYNIYRSTDNSSFPLISNVSTNSYTASGLTINTTYYYKVSAVNASSNESAATSAVSITPATATSTVSGGGGAPQSITTIVLNTPNGNEKLTTGSPYRIMWSTGGSTISKVRLSLSSDGGLAFSAPFADNIANEGGYSWIVPSSTGTTFRIKIDGLSSGGTVILSDISDGNFTISSGSATLTPAPLAAAPVAGITSGTTFSPSAAATASPNINTDKGLVVAASASCVGNTLIKSQISNAVYYCGSDGKRYVFANEKVYLTWYLDFSNVTIVSDTVLADIPLGGVVTYRPGTKMIKIESDSKVYAVATNGLLRWVTSEALATKLYGAAWNKQIDDLPVSFFARYKVGADVTE